VTVPVSVTANGTLPRGEAISFDVDVRTKP
jgi:hypothetical protein